MKRSQVIAADQVDTVTVDVPLLIRLLEYAREDAKTDMDLHNLAENLIKAKRTLTMDDYDHLVPHPAVESALASVLMATSTRLART
jgi:hypothetical protein